MKAVVYKGPYSVEVEDVEKPGIQHPNEVIVKVTSTVICGSDLHMYEGRTAAEPGIVFGHENMGIIEELGDGVTSLKEGDRVVMPFNVACGFCVNCVEGYTAFCQTVNPGFAGGAYGYVAMGPWPGGQAEYLRVPYADFNCLKLPPGNEHETDFMLLADIFPTGYHGCELAQVRPGRASRCTAAGRWGSWLLTRLSCAEPARCSSSTGYPSDWRKPGRSARSRSTSPRATRYSRSRTRRAAPGRTRAWTPSAIRRWRTAWHARNRPRS